MRATLVSELSIFWICICYGLAIVVSYDLVRCMRRIFRHNIFFISVEDLLFWGIWTIYILSRLIKCGCGIRLYYFTGLFLGALFAICIFELYVMPIAFKICGYFNKLFQKVIMLLKINLKLVRIITTMKFKEIKATDKVVSGVSKSNYEKKYKKEIN